MTQDNWPKRPDGTSKKFGELTSEERREVLKSACKKVEQDFARPEVQDAIQKVLDA